VSLGGPKARPSGVVVRFASRSRRTRGDDSARAASNSAHRDAVRGAAAGPMMGSDGDAIDSLVGHENPPWIDTPSTI